MIEKGFLLLLLVASVANAADTPCDRARSAFDGFIVAQSRACHSVSDCDTYFLSPDSCSPPFVLAKPGPKGKALKDLEGIQKEFREKCLAGKPPGPACAPVQVKPVCLRGECKAF